MSTRLTISDQLNSDEFHVALEELLRAAEDGRIAFDRSWEVESEDGQSNLMVEITRVVPSAATAER